MRFSIKLNLVIVLYSVLVASVFGFAPCDYNPMVLAEFHAWHGLASHTNTPYDSRNVDIISGQIQKAKDMGIDGFVVNWYGNKDGLANDNDREFIDQATGELVKQAEENNFLIALMYDEGTLSQAGLETTQYMGRVQSDLSYAKKYFSSPAYLYINGYPALFTFSYTEADKHIDWLKVRNELGIPVTLLDNDPYPDELIRDNNFDGFYAWVYAQWDINGKEWGESHLNWFYLTMAEGIYSRKIMIGGVWPGFDDLLAPWGDQRYMARQDGLIYNKTWALAEQNNAPIVMIATWNDFEEGTDIEFGAQMIVDMEDPDPALLVRSSPIIVTWDLSRGEAVLQVYKDGDIIYDKRRLAGVLIELESATEYEFKIWVTGSSTPISKWIKTRSNDPIVDTDKDGIPDVWDSTPIVQDTNACVDDDTILQGPIYKTNTQNSCRAASSISIQNGLVESGSILGLVSPQISIGGEFNAVIGSRVRIIAQELYCARPGSELIGN